MAQFLGIHDTNDMYLDTNKTAGDDAWADYKAACAQRGLKPLHVHYSKSAGKAFCVTEANSVDEVKAAHDDANLKLQEVLEVEYSE